MDATTVALAVAGLIASAAAARFPHAFVVATLIVTVSVQTLVHLTGVGAIGQADDAMVAVFVLSGLARVSGDRPLSAFPLAPFALFAAAGLAGDLVVSARPSIAASGLWLAVKGVAFCWAVAQLSWTTTHLRRAAVAGLVVIVVAVATAALNALWPAAFASRFSGTGGEQLRFGLPSLTGVFVHPVDLAAVTAYGGAVLLCYLVLHRSPPPLVTLWICCALTLLLTFRRKEILAFLLAGCLIVVLARHVSALITGVFGLALLAVAVTPMITSSAQDLRGTYLTNGDTAARTVMTRDSIGIADAMLPLGAGFGRFGSWTAAGHYSPEYEARGYPAIWGLSDVPGKNRFLTDSTWPAIIGETGWLGTTAFLGGIALIVRRVWRRFRRSSGPAELVAAGAALSAVLVAVVESPGATVFTSPPFYVLVFGIVGIALGADGKAGPAGPGKRATPTSTHYRGGPGKPDESRKPDESILVVTTPIAEVGGQ